ncbi:hypothetical protein BH09ACT12_BH09ACT12_20060 [soil metagenome]
MTTYVAFLRAINLGATRKFPKDAIAVATASAGFTGVATHINTGNVRLETAMRSRTRIESALEQAYLAGRGFEVPTMVFTCAELAAVSAAADRLGEGHAGRHYVSLLKAEPDAAAVAKLEALGTKEERVVVDGRAAHLLLGENYHEAKIGNQIVEKHLGPATNRNVTVIRALVAKWC